MSSQTLSYTFLPHSTKKNASTVLLRPSPRQHRGMIKAMVREGKDSLDNLQRISTGSPQQNKLSTRVSPLAPIAIWDRFPRARTVQQMLETMERLIEDPFSYPSSLAEETGSNNYRRGRTPWEIKEGESDYKMRFDVPGMTREDVKVSVEEKMLVVRAEKVAKSSGSEQEEGDEWSAKSYGLYSTKIASPENAEVEQIKAEVKDGVLYITVPKIKRESKVLDINVE